MRGHIVKRGNTYSIVFYIDDPESTAKKQKWIGGFKSKKEAENALADVLYKIQNNSFINPLNLTLKEFLSEWLKTYVEPNLEPTTISGYTTNINRHVIPHIGNIKLQKLRAADIQSLYTMLQERGRCDGKGGLSAKSVVYVHRVLKESLAHAVRQQLIPRNIADDVKPPSPKKYKAKVYDQQGILKLLQAVSGTEYEVPITIAAIFGLRRGEVLGLRWSDIDIKKKTLQVSQQLIPTKKGLMFKSPKSEDSVRTIYIPDRIVSLLQKEKQRQRKLKISLGSSYTDQDLVCCRNDGTPIGPSYFSKIFSNILKINKLEHIRFHDLRHSAATNMLNCDVPIKVASQILGHSNVGITMDIYSHVLEGKQKEAINKIETAIFGD